MSSHFLGQDTLHFIIDFNRIIGMKGLHIRIHPRNSYY